MSMLNKLGIGYTVESMVKNRSWVHYDYVPLRSKGIFKVPAPVENDKAYLDSILALEEMHNKTYGWFKPGELHDIPAHSAFGFSRSPKSSFHLRRLESRINSILEDVNYDPHSMVIIDKIDEFLSWEARMYVDHFKKHNPYYRDIGLGVQGVQEVVARQESRSDYRIAQMQQQLMILNGMKDDE